MWSHIITSDVSGVMDALARQNKEVELGFRASRMDRIAREAEMQRMREIREAREREVRGDLPEEDQGAGPSTPREKADITTENNTSSSSSSAAPPAMPSTPVFGQVKEKPSGSTAKKTGKKTKDVSAETAHKMSNLTAMRATGGKLGKYSWLNNTPNVSSPLAGKKRKGIKPDSDASATGTKGDKVNGDGEGSGSTETNEAGPSKKSKLSQSTLPDPSTPQPKRTRSSRPNISVPSRRLVPVYTPSLAAEGPGAEKRMVPDDQALTSVDVLFALEREGFGRGLGATEEVVWKVQGRAGGVWGKEAFGDAQGRR